MVRPEHAVPGTELEMAVLGARHRVTAIPESPYNPENLAPAQRSARLVGMPPSPAPAGALEGARGYSAATGIGDPSGRCVGLLFCTLARSCISSYQRFTCGQSSGISMSNA
jgi:hypothetical protein